jgi:hypothetical protein
MNSTRHLPTPWAMTSLMTEHAHARKSDPSTSHAAAASFTTQGLNRIQNQVLGVFRQHLFMDDNTLIQEYRKEYPNTAESTIRTRRAELVTKGLLRDSQMRVKLPSGKMGIVWEIVVP